MQTLWTLEWVSSSTPRDAAGWKFAWLALASCLLYVGAMKNFLMIAALSLVGACGNGDLDSLTKLKDEACACKDKACAEAVNKKMDDTLNKMKEPSADQIKKLEGVMEEAGKCLAKHM